ncbi:MAG: hypothetical protein HY996_09215 [Micrococcales bacterium]|nr:hypothetical protein [Micrococcales bacterium]
MPEENTLGIVVGRPSRGVGGAARRLTRPGSPYRSSLGASFLAIGAAVIVGLRALYGLTVFAAHWTEYPLPLIGALAWLVFAATYAVILITARVTGDRLPSAVYAVVLGGLAAAFALDLVAIWPLQDIGAHATAAPVAAAALVMIVPLQSRAAILIPAAAAGIAILVAVLTGTRPLGPATASDQILVVAATVLPALIAVVLVDGFRYMVQVELDRVLVQSTVQAPRFAVGMLASEELARLDLTAEELFENIAGGKVKLPLSPRSASVAASLATELRLHLIEGRRETWLYHAVSESEVLGKSVTLVDKSSLAGLLDPAQRDGLLSAVWMLVSDTQKRAAPDRTLEVQIGPVVPGSGVPGTKIAVPVVIRSTGVRRNRVDPSVWDSLARVGRYSDSIQDASLRLDIDCLVENPADARTPG